MSKKDSFLNAVTLLKQKYEQFQQHDNSFGPNAQDNYMLDTKNWLLVHATGYKPKNNKLQTTGHATNYAVPRATIHFTLNHTVTANSGGNWNTRPYIILTPYEDTIKTNNLKPAEVSWFDTFFVPDPDKDLQLPASARIIHPGPVPEGKLFQIKGNETIYKDDLYTDDEIKEILSLLPKEDRIQYEHWLTGGQEHQNIIGTDQESLAQNLIAEDYTGRLKKIYDTTKDKQAFLIGLLEESRYEMLTQFVRDIATRATIENMGYKKTNSNVAETVEQTAIETNIPSANAGQSGHDSSFYGRTENVWQMMENTKDLLLKNIDKPEYISEEIKLTLLNAGHSKFGHTILNNIIYNKPISQEMVYNEFVTEFEDFKSFETTKAKTISEFDKNLDKVLHKHCEWRANNFQETFQKLRKRPDFNKMVTQLKNDFANIIAVDVTVQKLNSYDR